MNSFLSAVLIVYFLFLETAFAGFNGVTHHSRANCANNESISWDWTVSHWFWVNSDHLNARTGTIIHGISTGWQSTWRCAAVHWGEGTGGWKVHGLHWMVSKNGDPILMAEEFVTDCSIYDGWWDRNK